jgi:hypothetical protein
MSCDIIPATIFYECFLRMLKWCAEVTPRNFKAVFAAYSRNPIAILLGAAAIEGYTNYAGHSLCKDWEQFVKGSRRFSTKLKHVFSSCNKSSKLSQRVYQDTMTLVRFRGSLAHPRFIHLKEVRNGPPPILFDHIDVDYPAAKVFKVEGKFKDSLLKDLDLEDAYWRQSYVSPP